MLLSLFVQPFRVWPFIEILLSVWKYKFRRDTTTGSELYSS